MLKEEHNSYHRRYQLIRYHKRLKEATEKLGGKCVHCGTEENLEFDHINPETKIGSISRIWSSSKEKFEAEIKKCQLLCRICHQKKSVKESGKTWFKGTDKHGTLSSLRYCKCEVCKQAKRDYNSRPEVLEKRRQWRKQKKGRT